jgi:hypothetical protein
VLEDVSTKKNRDDAGRSVLRDRDELGCRMEVWGEGGRYDRAVGPARVHHRYHAFVMLIAGILMETLVQPGRSSHREAEKELESKRENQSALPCRALAKILHGRDTTVLPDWRQLLCLAPRQTDGRPREPPRRGPEMSGCARRLQD